VTILNWKDPLKSFILFPNGIAGRWWVKIMNTGYHTLFGWQRLAQSSVLYRVQVVEDLVTWPLLQRFAVSGAAGDPAWQKSPLAACISTSKDIETMSEQTRMRGVTRLSTSSDIYQHQSMAHNYFSGLYLSYVNTVHVTSIENVQRSANIFSSNYRLHETVIPNSLFLRFNLWIESE